MSNPLVSIVIPTYNCAPYIDQTIESILAQAHRPIEIVVVDDGSTDGTPAKVAAMGDPVHLIRQANQGVCVARNQGFQASRGDYVCFLDHDDYWFPWKLSRQIDTFRQYPETGVVFTDFELWNPSHGVFPDPQSMAPSNDAPPPVDPEFSGWIYHQFLIDCWALTSTAMIRRAAFEASSGFNPNLPYSEDWDLWLRLSREYTFIKLARVSTLYRQHPAQGNRKVRDIDYRTQILENAAATWGLSSRDGRAVTAQDFRHRMAVYHMQFGLHHLRNGSAAKARASFRAAWRQWPLNPKYPALIARSYLGWKAEEHWQ